MSLFGAASNPYDDIVANATDENLTSENWELIINLVDKVTDEGEQGARNVIASILRRLAHRNPNVQLYSLSLAEALSKNCGKILHAEIASRAFTQGLEKLITDRTTHDKVRRKALQLVGMWAQEWESDPTLGLMEECYNSLRAKNYSFNAPDEPPPPEVDDEVRRREEEELQRALEISMTDKGGRQQWAQYSLASGSSASASGSQAAAGPSGSASATPAAHAEPIRSYSGGYVPNANSSAQSFSQVSQPAAATPALPAPIAEAAPVAPSPAPSMSGLVTRVRALHTFEPSEAGELAFERGDIIKVVDRGYKDWWRGQLKGRTGIFPVNYVEPLPEPTAAELAAEAQQEANVFAQAANVDRLLAMLRQMDPAKDNLADNEEIQELYRSSMALRPKIVKLIDKYSQKRADLVAMNESFVKARTIFDRMMEESLARHSGYYEQRPMYGPPQAPYQMRPDSRTAYGPDPQAHGWNSPGYDQQAYNYPVPPAAYSPPMDGQFSHPQLQHQASFAPSGPQPQPMGPYAQQYPPQDLRGQYQQGQQQLPNQQPISPQPQPDPYQQQPQTQPQPQQAQLQQAQPQQAQPQQTRHQQPHAQFQPQPQSEPSPKRSAALAQQQQQLPTAAVGPAAQVTGPPYVFDPNATYPDANAQAWAQYYAAGGDDPTGSIYFISVPGIKPPLSAQDLTSPSLGATTQLQQQAQSSQVSLTDSQSSVSESSSPQSPLGQGAPSAAFVQAIQQQQQRLAHRQSVQPDGRVSVDNQRQSSLPDPYDAPSSAQQRQDSLPNPYGQAPYGQSPYPPQQQQQQQPHDAYAVQGLQSQLAGMHIGEGQGQPAHA